MITAKKWINMSLSDIKKLPLYERDYLINQYNILMDELNKK